MVRYAGPKLSAEEKIKLRNRALAEIAPITFAVVEMDKAAANHKWTKQWNTHLGLTAFSLTTSTVVIEKAHARNRRNNDPQSHWSSFSNMYKNKNVGGRDRSGSGP